MRRLLAVLAVSLSSLSCASWFTTKTMLRDTKPPVPAFELAKLEKRADVDNGGGGKECADLLLRPRSIERFLDDKGKVFNVGVIELSDDGHVSDDPQKEAVLHEIREVAEKNKSAVIVTFVHGWHHRPKVCDNNMACFRRVLNTLSSNETRPVFGVYIGWRGDSLTKLTALSFYDRKSTAHRIGHDGGREVLLALDELYRDLNKSIGEKHPVTLVTVGHSFGGALVYSASEGALVRELRNQHVVGKPASNCGGQLMRPIRPGIGDLVVLVNPAFEAYRYRTFAEDLKTTGKYSDAQLPVLLTVASEGDDAVKKAFPAGRLLYFAFMPWRSHGISDILGAGHYDPQTTHDLVVVDGNNNQIHTPSPPKLDPPVASAEDRERCKLGDRDLATCECEYAVPTHLGRTPEDEKRTLIERGFGTVATAPNEGVSLRVRPPGNWDPNTPFLVARAAPEVIPAHSDIYTPRFVTFLTTYIGEFLKHSKQQEVSTGDESPCVSAAP